MTKRGRQCPNLQKLSDLERTRGLWNNQTLEKMLKVVTVVTTAIVVCTVGPGEVVGDASPVYRIRKKISHHLVR